MSLQKPIILFLFFCQTLTAQQFNYTSINTTQGLPSSEVFDILQDKRGYMWFATNHGVARYNGKEFTTYTFADGLADNIILRICEDGKGRIWFTSQSNDVGYWENGKIYKPAVSKLLNLTIPVWDHITNLYVDSSENIWFNTLVGLFFSDAKHQHTTLIKKKPFSDCNIPVDIIDNVKAIEIKKRSWKFQIRDSSDFYNYTFAVRVNNTIQYSSILFPKKEMKLNRNRCDVIYSKKGDLFYSEDFNLFYISKNKKIEIKKFDREIVKIEVDHKNNLWVTFWKGGVSYFENADIHSKPIHLLDEYTVSDVCMDNEAGIWISTMEKGVFYIPSLAIRSYSNIKNLNDQVVCVGVANNKMIVGTYGNYKCEATTDTVITNTFLQKLIAANSKLFEVQTLGLNIYVMVEGKPIMVFDRSFNLLNPDKSFVYTIGGKGVVRTEDNTLWMLQHTFIRELIIEKAKSQTTIHSVPYRLTDAVPEKGSRLFVGSKKGLYLFDKGKITWLNRIDPLLKCPIAQLLKDAEGNLWIASAGNGLLKFKDNKVTQISVKDGLPSNSCTAIEKDSAGHLWIGTNKGLSCIMNPLASKIDLDIKNLTVNNGLNSNEITKLCVLNDTMWVGTTTGLNSININDVFANSIACPTYIRSVSIGNKVIDHDQLVFDHDQNNVKLKLDGLTYSASSDHFYRFRLIGLDSIWQETKTDEILFNSLPPGNYIFQAAVANPNGKWSTQLATYTFTIRKPFWFTWWFILIEIVCLGFLIYFIVYLKMRTITKKEAEKSRISKLLAEYQMKALTAQMNPHFIFNAINSIQSFIMQNHATIAYDYLEKFSRLIRLVLSNSNENEISLQQEMDTLLLYIELEQLRFRNAFEFKLSVDEHIPMQELMIPTLLLQPYIENAIWHGLMPLEEKRGAISLTIADVGDSLKITISDNGVGRKASDLISKKIKRKTHQSVGMDLTFKRVELFGDNQSASVQIIDNYNDANEPTGTTVEIILPKIETY